MDSFSTFNLEIDCTSFGASSSSSPILPVHHGEDDDMLRQLVDEDSKLGYGAGYCVIA
jgi:hypothetical protein